MKDWSASLEQGLAGSERVYRLVNKLGTGSGQLVWNERGCRDAVFVWKVCGKCEFIKTASLGSLDYSDTALLILNVICIILFVPGYLLGVCCINHNDLLSVWRGSPAWNMFVVVSLLLPVCAGILVTCWAKDRWKCHPIARTLSAFSSQSNPPSWVLVAAEINIEFRRIDKFCVETNSVVRLIVTDNWLLKVMPYNIEFARQDDSTLILSSCDNHSMSSSGPGGAQFLNIEVKSFVPNTKSFNIRLNALDFKDLQDKVNRPINVLQNITFHRTLTDRFLDAFKEQVGQNVLHETSQVHEC
uniref:Transmembrane protein n=1 Tax=Timema monikensis TaxID=170555 RepID=A0A7R9HRQ7_9NEOP|nr:unnamed protein product [Timema monikensis]